MSQEKYIGMDVHQATISVAVRDSAGKLIMECILETKAATILEFIDGLRGTLSVTFEEGTSAAWLHDLLKPHVSHLVVCDPRRNALLKDGSKSDRIDARKLAELLYGNQLHAVYHGEPGLRTLKELEQSVGFLYRAERYQCESNGHKSELLRLPPRIQKIMYSRGFHGVTSYRACLLATAKFKSGSVARGPSLHPSRNGIPFCPS